MELGTLFGAVPFFLAAILVYLTMDAIVGYWYDRTYRRK